MFIANLKFYKGLTQKRSQRIVDNILPLIPANSKILDFGCGNMFTAKFLADRMQNVHVTGVDVIRDQNLTDETLEHPKLDFVISDSSKIPFEDNTFDMSMVIATLHHTPDPEHFLRELVRVTKKEGHVLVLEEMYLNWIDKLWISGQDWILNKMKEGVPVPLNFRSNRHYKVEFRKNGLEIEFEGYFRMPVTMMHTYIYKLKNS